MKIQSPKDFEFSVGIEFDEAKLAESIPIEFRDRILLIYKKMIRTYSETLASIFSEIFRDNKTTARKALAFTIALNQLALNLAKIDLRVNLIASDGNLSAAKKQSLFEDFIESLDLGDLGEDDG